jgi:hypothetical protein
MKAKDYAKRYEANRTSETLADIIASFVQEAVDISEVRQAKSEAAQYAILDEQNQKWRAFARIVGDVKEEGFEMVVKDYAPEHYENWQQYNKRRMTRAQAN